MPHLFLTRFFTVPLQSPLQFPTVALQPLTLPNPLNSKPFSPTPTTLSPTPTGTLSYTSHQNRTKPILQFTHSHPHFNPSHHLLKLLLNHPQNTPLQSTLQQSFYPFHNQRINPKPSLITQNLSQIHPIYIPQNTPTTTQKSSEKHQKFTQISR